MTRTGDESFISFLREQTLSALPAPGLDPGAVLAASKRKRTVTLAARACAAVAVVGFGVVGMVALDSPRDRSAPPVDQVPTPSEHTPTPSESPEPTMCAEFPAMSSSGPSYEGWWSSSPARDDGSILTDPADWPPIMREHPQTAMIDTRTGKVLVTYDRYSCGPVADYVVPAGLSLPPDAVVVVDAITGEILETMSPPYFEPQW